MSDLARYYDESYPPSIYAPPAPVTPTVTTIVPATAAITGVPFTLTVNGTNFTNQSVISFDGVAMATTFVSATQLTTTISRDGATAGTKPVYVTTGTEQSNTVTFTYTVSEEPETQPASQGFGEPVPVEETPDE